MQENQIILALESSGASSSVALYHQGQVIGFERFDAPHGHAERLVLQASACLQQADMSFNQLTHIAAGRGPGSFTGMRTCLATATGFSLAHGAQAVGVNGLSALARDAFQAYPTYKDWALLSLSDSRRQSRYAQLFMQQDKQIISLGDILDIPDDALVKTAASLSQKHGLAVALIGALPAACDWPDAAQQRHDLDARAIAGEADALIKAHIAAQTALPGLKPLYLEVLQCN